LHFEFSSGQRISFELDGKKDNKKRLLSEESSRENKK
tara:strand:+ start:40 stop:150 length:111 start_codon:yes stop_codon:yes gene_type:complete